MTAPEASAASKPKSRSASMNIAANGIRRHLLSIARRIEWQELNKHNSGQQMLHLATCTFVSTKLREVIEK